MKKQVIKEGLAELAGAAERDHEVQMARAELYKLAKYSIKLHDMLKSVSEEQGLEGWIQAKITKASDYISSVYHNLDYDMAVAGDDLSNPVGTSSPVGESSKSKYSKKKKTNESADPFKAKLHAKLHEKASTKIKK